jgi:hypothetical protein
LIMARTLVLLSGIALVLLVGPLALTAEAATRGDAEAALADMESYGQLCALRHIGADLKKQNRDVAWNNAINAAEGYTGSCSAQLAAALAAAYADDAAADSAFADAETLGGNGISAEEVAEFLFGEASQLETDGQQAQAEYYYGLCEAACTTAIFAYDAATAKYTQAGNSWEAATSDYGDALYWTTQP